MLTAFQCESQAIYPFLASNKTPLFHKKKIYKRAISSTPYYFLEDNRIYRSFAIFQLSSVIKSRKKYLITSSNPPTNTNPQAAGAKEEQPTKQTEKGDQLCRILLFSPKYIIYFYYRAARKTKPKSINRFFLGLYSFTTQCQLLSAFTCLSCYWIKSHHVVFSHLHQLLFTGFTLIEKME